MIGVLSDWLGRRRLILAVMVFDAILFAATGFTKDVTALIVLRLLAGFSAPVALGIGYVADISYGLPPARAQFNFALVGVSFNLGALIGAATGGLLGADLWLPANLAAGAVPALVAAWALASEDTPKTVSAAPTSPAAAPSSPAAAPSSTAAAPAMTSATASASAPAALSCCTVALSSTKAPRSRPRGAMRRILLAPEYAANLLAFVANGLFQGGFFSLMPVILTERHSNSTASQAAGSGGNITALNSSDGGADDSSAQIIAAVIIAAGVLQIVSNLLLVRPSLRCFGSIGHTAWTNGICALLLAPIAALVSIERSSEGVISRSLFVGALLPRAKPRSLEAEGVVRPPAQREPNTSCMCMCVCRTCPCTCTVHVHVHVHVHGHESHERVHSLKCVQRV